MKNIKQHGFATPIMFVIVLLGYAGTMYFKSDNGEMELDKLNGNSGMESKSNYTNNDADNNK